MDEGELDAELVGDGSHPIHPLAACAMGWRAHTPLRTTRIWRHNDTVPPIRDVALDVRDEQRLRIQVVHRDVEEALVNSVISTFQIGEQCTYLNLTCV